MRTVLPRYKSSLDWQGKFGHTRERMIEKILRGNWLGRALPKESVLIATETRYELFSLAFDCYRNIAESLLGDGARKNVRAGKFFTRFDILFNYRGKEGDIRLRDVTFWNESRDMNGGPWDSRRKNLGGRLLGAAVLTALDIGANRIFVEPGNEGSYYWPSRGAVIGKWPSDGLLDYRARNLLEPGSRLIADWKLADREELRRICEQKNAYSLGWFAARDDLFVPDGDEKIRLRRYLLDGLDLGPCVFDFGNVFTLHWIRERQGIDIMAEQERRRPVPVAPGSIATPPKLRTAEAG